MAMDKSFAKAHIGKWINAWNVHDLKAIISFYAENIEFKSPKIKVVYPDKTKPQFTTGRIWKSIFP